MIRSPAENYAWVNRIFLSKLSSVLTRTNWLNTDCHFPIGCPFSQLFLAWIKFLLTAFCHAGTGFHLNRVLKALEKRKNILFGY